MERIAMDHPALCTGCKAFYPSGISKDKDAPSGPATIPCPGCGEKGSVADGVDSFIRRIVELLSAPERSISEIERLSAILVAALQKEAAFAHVGETIKESIPPLSPVAELLPPSSAERYAFITVALKSIVLFVGELGQSDNPTVEVDQVLNAVYAEEVAPPSSPTVSPSPEGGAKVGRNEPCPCGSGKKYKKCCL